ncbi:hypothetical protein LINPERPRIM_LOCUS6081 [Linum perenne]
MSVQLPDGELVSVTHIGDVHLTCDLVLSHVLVIPSFKFNLLSVSRLVKHDAYNVSFFSSMCLFQDTKNHRTIGTAEMVRGMYWFHSHDQPLTDKNIISSCSSNFFDLWHFRLGHSS